MKRFYYLTKWANGDEEVEYFFSTDEEQAKKDIQEMRNLQFDDDIVEMRLIDSFEYYDN